MRLIKRLAMSLLTLFFIPLTNADTAPEIVCQYDFDKPSSTAEWSNSHIIEYKPKGGVDGGGCLAFTNKTPENAILASRPLDLKRVAGRAIMLEGMMKGENLTVPSLKYLGPKLMIHEKSPYSDTWIDQTKQYGSYDWKKFFVFARIPEQAEDVNLCLGLQGCVGTLYVDAIKVTIVPEPSSNTKQTPKSTIALPQKTKFRGVMSGHHLKEADFRELAKWNVNLIRFQIVNPRNSGVDLSTGKAFQNWIDSWIPEINRVLKLCEKYNIKVVLDLHSGPAAKQGKLYNNKMAWNHDCQDSLVKAWEKLASTYKNNPAVWGYDILNEPREDDYVYMPNGPLDWNRLAEKIALAIRNIDKETPIIVEPPRWGSPQALLTFKPIAVDNVIYSVHFYAPHQYTHQGIHNRPDNISYPGKIAGKNWDKETIRKQLEPVVWFQKKYNVPIYIGEFSVARWAPGGARWLKDTIDIFEENGWDWTYHAFREYHGWSVEHSSDKSESKRQERTDRKDLLLNYFKRDNASGNIPATTETDTTELFKLFKSEYKPEEREKSANEH